MRPAVRDILLSRRPDILAGAGKYGALGAWTLTGSAAIADDVLSFTTGGRASLPVANKPGTYEVTYTVISRVTGDITFNFADDDAGANSSTQVFGSRFVGTHKLYVQAQGANDTFRVNGVSAYEGDVDNVSVRFVA